AERGTLRVGRRHPRDREPHGTARPASRAGLGCGGAGAAHTAAGVRVDRGLLAGGAGPGGRSGGRRGSVTRADPPTDRGATPPPPRAAVPGDPRDTALRSPPPTSYARGVDDTNQRSSMRFASSVTDLVGGTPLVRLSRVTEGIGATVLAKVEFFNPGGSVKDRIARRIIDAAEESGQLRPGGTIVEPTSGNTGVGLALIAQQRGYRCIFVCPDKVSEDKRDTLRADGAEVVVAPSSVAPDDPQSYYSVSDRLAAEIPGGY